MTFYTHKHCSLKNEFEDFFAKLFCVFIVFGWKNSIKAHIVYKFHLKLGSIVSCLEVKFSPFPFPSTLLPPTYVFSLLPSLLFTLFENLHCYWELEMPVTVL